jgi:putative redox protein
MRIEVVRESGVRFTAHVGAHELVYDQPESAGGTGTGPTPTDAFVASLAGCVAHYATQFLVRHERSADGLRVVADFSMAAHPSRVAAIAIEVVVKDELPGTEAAALRAVVEHCTVHNSIVQAPHVAIAIATEPPAARSLQPSGLRWEHEARAGR